MKIRLSIILALFLGIVSIQAQEKGHYLYFNGGAGLHNLQYDLTNGSQEGSLGYTFNLGYNYFFTDNWGIGTGVGIQSFNTKSALNYMSNIPSVDTDGETYEYRTYYNDWKEEQKALLLDIPIGLAYQTKINQKWKLLASAGGKISFSLNDQYKTTGGEIKTTGYYPQYNVELYGMSQHGFSTHTYTDFPEKEITLNAIYSAFIDLGGLYTLKNNLDLYLGVYLNYGLNSAVDAKDNELYQQDGTYNGMLACNQVDKVSPVSYGIKIGLSWHPVCKKAVKRQSVIESKPTEPIEETPKVEPQPEPEPFTEPQVEPELKAEPQPIMEETAEQKAYVEAKIVAVDTDIKFVLNSDKIIGDPQNDKLKDFAELLKANANMKLRIVGHTCDIASKKVNIKVGNKRAKLIYDKLKNFGVNPAQMTTESKWFSEPLVPNISEENRAKNRRVQLIIE